ncbi:aminopeptidase N [Serratia sp. Ag1]|nr:aminopeptidase N [Serratia sp. Ag2]KFK98917.1 aminopeptidase N [Serratia sp. Ag1]
MIIQIIDAPHGDSLMARTRVINIILLALFGLSLALFNIQEKLLIKAMKKNEAAEQTDDEIAQRVKLTRYFVENITNSATGRVYWEHIKTSYRKGGFIFIHMRNDSCIVIPERVFTSESEAACVVEFIHAQIAQRKQQTGQTPENR